MRGKFLGALSLNDIQAGSLTAAAAVCCVACILLLLLLLLFRGPGKIALGLASPVFITSLIMYVSGVPMLEEQHDQKYGDDPRCALCISHKSFSCPKLLRLSYALADDTFSSFWEWHDPRGKWGWSLERLYLRLSLRLCLRLLYACVFACVPGDVEVDVYVHTVMRPPTLLSCSLKYILLLCLRGAKAKRD